MALPSNNRFLYSFFDIYVSRLVFNCPILATDEYSVPACTFVWPSPFKTAIKFSHVAPLGSCHAGRGAVGKIAVIGIKDRSGIVRAKPVASIDRATLHGFISANVANGAAVMTDNFKSYRGLDGYIHSTVNHSLGEYVRDGVHTNGIESFWSLLKRGYYGIYHYMSAKHLHRYVSEFANRQSMVNFSTMDFIEATIENMADRHISYKELINVE